MVDRTAAYERDHSYRAMLNEAEQQGLADPPPYSTDRQRAVWQSGYRDALRDIANRKVRPR